MVFNTQTNEIFVSFKYDFNKIWKVNLEGNTIETYKGFDEYAGMKIKPQGITASELQKLKAGNNTASILTISLFLVVLIILFASFIITRKKVFHK